MIQLKLGVSSAGFCEYRKNNSDHVGFTFVCNESYVNHVSMACTPGFMVALFFKNSVRPVLHKFNPYKKPSESERFSALVQSLPNDCIVAICVSDTISTKGRPLGPLFFDTLMLLGSDHGFKSIGYRHSFAFIGMKKFCEGDAVYSTGSVSTVVRAFVEVQNCCFVQSCLRKVAKREKLDVQVGSLDKVYYVSDLRQIDAFNKGYLLHRQCYTRFPTSEDNKKKSDVTVVRQIDIQHQEAPDHFSSSRTDASSTQTQSSYTSLLSVSPEKSRPLLKNSSSLKKTKLPILQHPMNFSEKQALVKRVTFKFPDNPQLSQHDDTPPLPKKQANPKHAKVPSKDSPATVNKPTESPHNSHFSFSSRLSEPPRLQTALSLQKKTPLQSCLFFRPRPTTLSFGLPKIMRHVNTESEKYVLPAPNKIKKVSFQVQHLQQQSHQTVLHQKKDLKRKKNTFLESYGESRSLKRMKKQFEKHNKEISDIFFNPA